MKHEQTLEEQTEPRAESIKYSEQIDIVENQPNYLFLAQVEQPPQLIETSDNIWFALRRFHNSWSGSEPEKGIDSVLTPVIFFTQWGVGIDSKRGEFDVYGLLDSLEPGREVITIDIPGLDQASKATKKWRDQVDYLTLGEELALVLDEAGYSGRNFHIGGVSHGGNVAVGLAAALGERARSVTVVSSPGAEPLDLANLIKGFSVAERKNLKQAIKSSPDDQAAVIRELESSKLNKHKATATVSSLLALIKFARLMARRPLADGVERFSDETVLSIFCGNKEAILNWKDQLRLVRERNQKKVHRASLTLIGGGGDDNNSVVATHARLSVNRLEPGAQIAATVHRLDKIPD